MPIYVYSIRNYIVFALRQLHAANAPQNRAQLFCTSRFGLSKWQPVRVICPRFSTHEHWLTRSPLPTDLLT